MVGWQDTAWMLAITLPAGRSGRSGILARNLDTLTIHTQAAGAGERGRKDSTERVNM